MKSSSVSSRGAVARLAAVLVVWVTLAAPAWAGVAERGQACLRVVDIACAQQLAALATEDPADQRFLGDLDFHLQKFAEAVRRLEAVEGSFTSDPSFAADLALYRQTLVATAGFATEVRGDVQILYQAGIDQVLLDDAFEALQAAHDVIAPRLGGAPPGMIRVELYPSATTFIQASGLGEEAVRKTGVVALSKWSRLLVTSPRALLRGYAWKDTVAHEYIHYVIAWRTKDRAPVWLQEGVARSHETLWHSDRMSTLAPYQQSLLATALANDSMVTLEQMHPSMAFLPSADAAALAFAEVSSMVEYLETIAGKGATRAVLDRVRDGEDALAAVAAVATEGDSDRFMAGWKAWLGTLDLVGRQLAAPRTVIDGASDDLAMDPVLAERVDLARFVHLGDLLLAAKRPDAALIEYQRGVPPDEPPSPMLSLRVARALDGLGRAADAVGTLRASVADYPEYASTRKELGTLLLRAGDRQGALRELLASHDVNPFDPEVQATLADLYTAAGDAERAARHRRYRQILVLGGSELTAKEDG